MGRGVDAAAAAIRTATTSRWEYSMTVEPPTAIPEAKPRAMRIGSLSKTRGV